MQRFVPEGCEDHCPTVKINTLRFDTAPELTQALRQRLLGMAQLQGGEHPREKPADFHAFAQQLFHESEAMQRQNPEIAPYSARFVTPRCFRSTTA